LCIALLFVLWKHCNSICHWYTVFIDIWSTSVHTEMHKICWSCKSACTLTLPFMFGRVWLVLTKICQIFIYWLYSLRVHVLTFISFQ
jgi:hypothetical protein